MLFSSKTVLSFFACAALVSAVPQRNYNSGRTRNGASINRGRVRDLVRFGNNSLVAETTCNDGTYVYQELAGYGFVPSAANDKFGNNLGGLGSGIAVDTQTWRRTREGYQGVIWSLPDRGWCV